MVDPPSGRFGRLRLIAKLLRCCAAGVSLTRHPQMGAVKRLRGRIPLTSFSAKDCRFMFTDVNAGTCCRLRVLDAHRKRNYRNYSDNKRIQADTREVSIGVTVHGLS